MTMNAQDRFKVKTTLIKVSSAYSKSLKELKSSHVVNNTVFDNNALDTPDRFHHSILIEGFSEYQP